MTLKFHWFLPTSGDGRAIMGRGHSLPLVGRLNGSATENGSGSAPHITGAAAQDRPPDIEYLAQIARSAEQLGFEAVLTPTGTWCEDAWLTTAALTRDTQRLKFLVAFRPGLISPTLAAQMAATYQRLSRGRLLLNVVTGGQADEQRRFGDHLSHDERYARTGEFLAIVRGAWSGQPFDFTGEHYQVTGATVMRPPDPVPGVYFGGSSPAAGPVAARYADTYLTWGEPPAQVAEKLAWIRGLAKAEGRTLRCTLPTAPAAPPRTWRSTRTCGPGSAWSAAAPARRWSAATCRWRISSRNTPRSGSASSSCPATRIWKRRTGSARACCPNSASAGPSTQEALPPRELPARGGWPSADDRARAPEQPGLQSRRSRALHRPRW
jgi:hypothetical protein